MKGILTAVALSAAAMCSGAELAMTNTLLTIRETGVPPAFTNVLGTVSDMARLQAQLAISSAMAAQAAGVYSQTTQLLNEVSTDLASGRSAAFRRYFLESFVASMLIDDTRDKCVITSFVKAPASRQTVPGSVAFDIGYAFKGTSDIRTLKGIFKVSQVLTVPSGDWNYLSEDLVTDPVAADPYVDPDGVEFNYGYTTTLYIPEEAAGFVVVSIQPQAADADGSSVVLYGGDRDGISATIRDGGLVYEILGGRVVGVTEAE